MDCEALIPGALGLGIRRIVHAKQTLGLFPWTALDFSRLRCQISIRA